MSLVRWDPFQGIDEVFARMPSAFGGWPRAFGNDKEILEWSPSVVISETDTEYLIRANLPAVKKEDIRVTVDDRMLTISGERRQKSEDTHEKVHRVESVYGTFSRSFALPDNADGTNIRADAKEGVITVHVAKARTEPRKTIEIKVQ